MIVGKMLKEKYGFDNEEVVKMFCEQYGYSKKFVEDLLNDKWDDLLICHAEDIRDFTKIEKSLFDGWTSGYSFGNTCAPLGKPYDNPMCELAKVEIDLSPFEPKLFVRHTEFGSTVRAGFFPNPGEVEFKPEEGDLTPSALNMLNAIGVTPVQFCQGDDNGDPKFLGQVLDQLRSGKVVHNSDIPVTRSKRTHELDEEDVNRIYPQRTVNLLEGIELQSIPLFEPIPALQYSAEHIKQLNAENQLPDMYPIVQPFLPVASDLLSPDWESIEEKPTVIPDPGPENIIVPLELFESMADACSDGGFSVPATRAYDLLEKHEEKYGE